MYRQLYMYVHLYIDKLYIDICKYIYLRKHTLLIGLKYFYDLGINYYFEMNIIMK